MDKQTNNQKGVAHILAIIILLLGILAGIHLIQKTQIFKSRANIEDVDLSLQPNQINAVSGQELTVNVFSNTHNYAVSAAEVNISFDPNQVEIRQVQRGTSFPVVLQTGQVINNEAKITVGVNPGNPFRGNGTIATLTVVLKPNFTSSTLQFTNQTKIAALGRQDNAVGSLNSTTLTLSVSSPSPSSSPYPTPSPTPSPLPSPSPSPSVSPPSPTPAPSSFLTSPGPSSTRPSPSQSPSPSPRSTPRLTPSPKTPTQVEPPDAFRLIQQREQEPSPSPPVDEDAVLRIVNSIPVLRTVINYFVDIIGNVLNFWKNL